jgi:hypothetical protein
MYGGSSCYCNSSYVAPFTRVNRDQRDLKTMGVFMNDSTYLNASDPNSMRDQGMVRNAPYRVNVEECRQLLNS